MYTVMMVDIDIFTPDNPIENFFHFMAINVRDLRDPLTTGEIVHDYVPPFAFLYNPDVNNTIE